MKLNQYKTPFKKAHIPHRKVAAYTGMTREHTTLILNGANVPTARAEHLTVEFDELLKHYEKRNKVATNFAQG
jgi:hypothetical protein